PFVLHKQKFRELVVNNPDGRPTKEQIDEYRKEAHRLKANERGVIARRRDIDKVIGLADKFIQYPAFYIPHHCDFRGRVYPAVNGELHQQRDDVSKSLIYCAEGKPMGERGWYWLRVCCASLGEKGETKNAHPDVRAKWVMDNLDTIRDVVNDPISNVRWWADADAPFQFLACCKEVLDAVESGNPEEFVSCFPINFDGACSGIQHYSCILR
ncbi:UNVERIFIED_CONTAM: DNA-directed RNA polymerase, partial [Kocuria sp. CPCC 205274]